jgi:hypothetical protein
MQKVADLAPRLEEVAALGPSLEAVGDLRSPIKTLTERSRPCELAVGAGVFLFLFGVVIYIAVMFGVRHGLASGRVEKEEK